MDYSDCTLIIDADTIVFKAAKGLQESYLEVTHNDYPPEKWKREFKNVTAFYGRKRSRDGGWIAQENATRDEDKQIKFEDFKVTEMDRLVNPDNYGFSDIKKKIESIMTSTGCKDFRVIIGGDENYRYEAAHIKPYKGERKAKPIRFPEMIEWTNRHFDDKVIVADGEEADDVVAQFAHEDYLHHKKTGEHLYVISYIDKDIDMCIAPHCNYDKLSIGIKERDPYDAARCFCSQMLTGDSTDNIPGLPNLTDELRKKYDLKKSKGIGPAAVEGVFAMATTIPKLFQSVALCYREFYGEEEFDFTSHRGVKMKRKWYDMLDENCQLLFMRREKGVPYDTLAVLKRMGVDINPPKPAEEPESV